MTAAARVRIEPLGYAHADALHRLAHDPRTVERLFDVPKPTRAAIHAALTIVEDERRAQLGYAFAVMTSKAELVGFLQFDRDAERHTTAELGLFIVEASRGRGYATSAAALGLEQAFFEQRFEVIRADCAVSNVASRRVLEKLGFASSAPLPARDIGGEPLLAFALSSPLIVSRQSRREEDLSHVRFRDDVEVGYDARSRALAQYRQRK